MSTLMTTSTATAKSRNCVHLSSVKNDFKSDLTELQAIAIRLGPVLCNNALQVLDSEKNTVQPLIKEFSSLVRKELLSAYPEAEFPGMQNFAISYEQQLLDYLENPSYLAEFMYKQELAGPGGGTVDATFNLPVSFIKVKHPLTPLRLATCSNATAGKTCEKAAENLKNAINPAFILIDVVDLISNQKTLGSMQKDWQLFIDEARYQTPLDVWLTTTWNKSHFNKPNLVGPADLQYFLFRPSLVYERVNHLERGDRDNVSLAIELLGVNHWKWGIGASITTIYKDRNNTPSIGHGVTLHIKNKYSIGFVHRNDGNNSVFLNVDLLEVFFDNKDVYKKYKEYF
jgi:hypothetical protein